MDRPLYTISGLSHILPTSEACQILGAKTVRSIVRNFLRCIASIKAPAKSKQFIQNEQSPNNATNGEINWEEFSHILEKGESDDETYWIDLFTAALMYDFTNSQEKGIPSWCSHAWHRLMNLPSLKTYTNLTGAQLSQLQKLNASIPSPIIGLDRSTFMRSGILFPHCLAPHAGAGGHSALMECVFYAIASPPTTILLNRLAKVHNTPPNTGYTKETWKQHMYKEYTRAIVEGINPNSTNNRQNNQNARTTLLLPDLLVFWAVVKNYRDSFQNREEEDIPIGFHQRSPNQKDLRTRFTDKGSLALYYMAKLMYRIYDGFQKKITTVTRDTLQRFLTDIHGEGTAEKPNVKPVVDRMFAIKNEDIPGHRHVTQLTESQFVQAIRKTVQIIPHSDDTPKELSHIFINWSIGIVTAMMPMNLLDCDDYFSETDSGIGAGTYLQAKLDMLQNSTSDCEIIKLYRNFDVSDDGSGVRSPSSPVQKQSSSHMHLYEVKRRFQSMLARPVEDNLAPEDLYDVDSDDTSYSSDDSSMEEGRHLPIDECEDETIPSKTSKLGDLPRNTIDEDMFVRVLSEPDIDLGHGGFVTPKIARLVFRGGCLKAEEVLRSQSSRSHLEILSKLGIAMDDRNKSKDMLDVQDRNFWNIHDVVLFGCTAVRGSLISDDEEIPLLEFMFNMFTLLPGKSLLPSSITTENNNNQEGRFMTRDQIGGMLELLLEQFAYRVQGDTPNNKESDENTNNDWIGIHGENVDASAASLLGLMPASAVAVEDNPRLVPIEELVKQVFREIDKDCSDPSVTMNFKEFVQWTRAITDPNTSIEMTDRKVNPVLLELQLIGSIVFGVKPCVPTLERTLVEEIQKRFSYKYPTPDNAKRGPCGTRWFIIQIKWWEEWLRYSEETIILSLPKITNERLLVENGSLALQSGLRYKFDFEVSKFASRHVFESVLLTELSNCS